MAVLGLVSPPLPVELSAVDTTFVKTPITNTIKTAGLRPPVSPDNNEFVVLILALCLVQSWLRVYLDLLLKNRADNQISCVLSCSAPISLLTPVRVPPHLVLVLTFELCDVTTLACGATPYYAQVCYVGRVLCRVSVWVHNIALVLYTIRK